MSEISLKEAMDIIGLGEFYSVEVMPDIAQDERIPALLVARKHDLIEEDGYGEKT